jgi:hypothetical protein
VTGIGFGFQLGLGAVTIATSASIYLMWALELLTADPAAGAVVGVTFGIARALPLLMARDVTEPSALHGMHRRLERWRPRARWITIAGQALGGAVLLVAAA